MQATVILVNFLALFLLLLTACKTKPLVLSDKGSVQGKLAQLPSSPPSLLAQAAQLQDFPPLNRLPSHRQLVLVKERTGCWGKCPQYLAHFYASGRIEIQGISHLPNLGPIEIQIDSQQLHQLLEQSLSFSHYPKYYPQEALEQSPELPATLLYFPQQRQEFYLCYNLPKDLEAWELALDSLWWPLAFKQN